MVRPVAQRVWDAVMMDNGAAITGSCIIDFNLGDTQQEFEDRFGALQRAARKGATAKDFDKALGSGSRLTALVKKYGSDVVFPKTAYED